MDIKTAEEQVKEYYRLMGLLAYEKSQILMAEAHLSEIESDLEKGAQETKDTLSREKKRQEQALMGRKARCREMEQALMRLNGVMIRLEPEYRKILELKYKKKKTYVAIAMEMVMAETTARRTLRRALSAFGAELAEMD